MFKRTFDILFSLGVILLLSPLLLLVAILIKIESKGGVFFKAKRYGQNGQLFNFYKFRTMTVQATVTADKAMLTTTADARITRVGKILRPLKIDEFAQLFNVLKGDMSIVGPRPEVPEVVERYYTDEWKEVLRVKPGLTCLLQTKVYPDFTYYHPENVENQYEYYVNHDLPMKLKWDKKYAKNYDFWLDLKIIFHTAYLVVFKSWKYI